MARVRVTKKTASSRLKKKMTAAKGKSSKVLKQLKSSVRTARKRAKRR